MGKCGGTQLSVLFCFSELPVFECIRKIKAIRFLCDDRDVPHCHPACSSNGHVCKVGTLYFRCSSQQHRSPTGNNPRPVPLHLVHFMSSFGCCYGQKLCDSCFVSHIGDDDSETEDRIYGTAQHQRREDEGDSDGNSLSTCKQ